MRSLTTFFVLVVVFMEPSTLAHAQSTGAAAQPEGSASAAATKEEVSQLRSEVAAQRQTIEELKALVEKLAVEQARALSTDTVQVRPVADAVSAEASSRPVDAPTESGARLMNAVLVEAVQAAKPAAKDAKPAEKKPETPVVAGWNGEHFFIKSGDGKFQLQPYGYFMADYRGYHGDGAPSNTFLISRARLGFQGNYGTNYDFAFLIDASASNGILLRDLFVNIKPKPAFQVQAGQYKAPFSQEALTNDTALDFVERSMASLLYPNASSSYRSPA